MKVRSHLVGIFKSFSHKIEREKENKRWFVYTGFSFCRKKLRRYSWPLYARAHSGILRRDFEHHESLQIGSAVLRHEGSLRGGSSAGTAVNRTDKIEHHDAGTASDN